MTFEFATAGKILFGRGKALELGGMARSLGARAMVVTGRNPERFQPVLDALQHAGISLILHRVEGEPTVQDAAEGAFRAREERAELVIGLGGGSVLDAAKAIAALATNHRPPADYLEVIGQGLGLDHAPLPCIAVPTTAGTGSEATRNAVLSSPEHRVKVSLRSPLMLPRLAVIDPELTLSLPPDITATTGMDALTQLIEPYVCVRANPLTDGLCVEGIRRAARSLRRAVDNGGDTAAREDMAVASLFGGLALANAGLGAVHGFAAPIGGMFPAPHGAVCAALLPHVMAANVKALQECAPAHPALRRYGEVARLLTGSPQAGIQDGIQWVCETARQLGIHGLADMKVRESDLPELIARGKRASSMRANPIELLDAELEEILRAAL